MSYEDAEVTRLGPSLDEIAAVGHYCVVCMPDQSEAPRESAEFDYTDGWVSRSTLRAILGLPKKAQTALLRFLVELGPLDEVTSGRAIAPALALAASPAIRESSAASLKLAVDGISRIGEAAPNAVDIDLLRTIAEAPEEYHLPLLHLLLASRPVGEMSAQNFFLEIWTRVESHWTRTLGPRDVERITEILERGSAVDDALLRFLGNPRTNRLTTLEAEVVALAPAGAQAPADNAA